MSTTLAISDGLAAARDAHRCADADWFDEEE